MAEVFRRISIHALRGEGDLEDYVQIADIKDISIHALRGEGDPDSAKIFSKVCDFNPRPPWGGRRQRV